jgi:general secretion pathway protein N
MSRWSWLAIGVGLYLAFTVAMFPAGVALRWFAPQGVTFAGVAGTLWSGSAATCSVGGFSLEAVRWRLRPTSLFLGRVSANVDARIPDGFVRGDVTASSSSVRLSDFQGATSLPALDGVLPPVLRGMRGQASVALESLVLENGWPSAISGELKLAGLETPPPLIYGKSSLVALGNYTATFVPAPQGQIAAKVVDNGGPLEVAGTVGLNTARAYTIDALVKPRAEAPEMLAEGLERMTGEPDAEGRYHFNEMGTL